MNYISFIYNKLISNGSPSIDSRTVSEGDVFFALQGDNFNGNKFALQAIDKGAVLAVVDDQSLDGHKKIFVVNDVLQTLQEVALFHRNKLSIPIIALTGSNGKTTTKELINCVLSEKFKTIATKGNLNNHIGVPLTLLSITNDTEIAIVEMGANHIGEIATLCNIAQPTHGLITNIGKAHLEGFGSFEGVVRAKCELYGFLANHKRTTFFDTDNTTLQNIISKYSFGELVPYGKSINRVHSIVQNDTGLQFEFSMNSCEPIRIHTHLVGQYNVENILAAITIGDHFGVSPSTAALGIEKYIPSNSRSQIIRTSTNTVLLDAYNANPSSMEQALRNFNALPQNLPKIAILGEMLELGQFSSEEHLSIAHLASNLYFDKVFLVGNGFQHVPYGAQWFASSADCLEYIKTNPISNSMILLKGSRGVRMEVVLEVL